jgi:hypothetical protein
MCRYTFKKHAAMVSRLSALNVEQAVAQKCLRSVCVLHFIITVKPAYNGTRMDQLFFSLPAGQFHRRIWSVNHRYKPVSFKPRFRLGQISLNNKLYTIITVTDKLISSVVSRLIQEHKWPLYGKYITLEHLCPCISRLNILAYLLHGAQSFLRS